MKRSVIRGDELKRVIQPFDEIALGTVILVAFYISVNHVAFVPESKHMSASEIVHAPVKGGFTGKPDQEVIADFEFVSHEFDNPVNSVV